MVRDGGHASLLLYHRRTPRGLDRVGFPAAGFSQALTNCLILSHIPSAFSGCFAEMSLKVVSCPFEVKCLSSFWGPSCAPLLFPVDPDPFLDDPHLPQPHRCLPSSPALGWCPHGPSSGALPLVPGGTPPYPYHRICNGVVRFTGVRRRGI